jgi:hypothetical protein
LYEFRSSFGGRQSIAIASSSPHEFILGALRNGQAGARSQAYAPRQVTKSGIGSKPGKRRLARELDEIGAGFLVSFGQPRECLIAVGDRENFRRATSFPSFGRSRGSF